MIDSIRKREKMPIVLDLNKVDFERNIQEGEIWQQDAVFEFNQRLAKTIKQAKKHKDNEGNNPTIIHDAIFIGGARGTGKTVFLQNIKGFWKKYKDENDLDVKAHFCDSIDPTLLVDHDNFANVIIAHLYNEVETYLESKQCNTVNQDSFYQSLRIVSKSLGKQENLEDGLSGLDRVIKYRSGIQLVKHFDSYINECRKILDVDAIVLPIDDIDMALARAYDVLDIVRRLLGCPKIIPIITGDLELYEPIIENRFTKDEGDKSNEIIGSQKAEQLTQEYLKKVIPHHNRISLEPIDRLLPGMIIYDFGDTEKREPLSYKDYMTKFISCLFGPLNSEEKSCDWPKPDSAREVTQLVRDFSPSELTKENRAELWQRYIVWARLKQNSVAYSNAVTALQIENSKVKEANDYITLNKLHSFNPILQMNDLTPKWQGKLFFGEQVSDKLNADNELVKRMSQHFEEFKNKKVYRSMPIIEHFYGKFKLTSESITDENIQETTSKGKEQDSRNDKRMLLDIFTYNNYYDLTLKTQRQIFFSRAYELLAISLLNFDFKLEVENKDYLDKRLHHWESILKDLFSRTPFYTVPALFPTKAFNIGPEEELTDEEEIKLVSNITIRELSSDIATWEVKYLSNLKYYKNDSLMPIIYSVFNKSFTQLRLLKDRIQKSASNDYKNETLTDLALRFKYIVINAFATFMKPSPVVLQNVAFTSNLNLIRNFGEHRRYSPPLRDNVGYFFNFTDSKDNKPFSEIKDDLGGDIEHKALLLQAIANHPIFQLLENEELKNGAFQLLIKKNNRSNDITESDLEETKISELNIKPIPLEDFKFLQEKLLKKQNLDSSDHSLMFGVSEEDIAAWDENSKEKNKQLVIARAKLICTLLKIKYNGRIEKVKFYIDNLKSI
ncbi:hypothetical protein FHG08_15855 [Pseudoalteromonas sp. Scap03]|uniref:hypothetical protein n=1 Tax=unclassified Pseudoalteromonas TaxID=194690 RepID=UPI0015BA94CC|nr:MULTISPECIES: hypothetical protein [unclassified Pseudoalteromonas]NWL17124.1 hypothetical protein [Pseudoalteromonas sp. Scap03]QLE83168.1 hypothetical protein FLM54_16695 [Pseudoalteromonas sp. Scap25]QLE91110.1 hypothetical protein FLM47_16705 [Pseudoalteromonas sp. Scap06]